MGFQDSEKYSKNVIMCVFFNITAKKTLKKV
jgi:hypothetical protein